MTITDKVKYILYDLTQFSKTLDSVQTTEDRWLYLLKHAGRADDLPDFGDDVLSQAIKRILVEKASDKLIKEQARDMVFTEEELDHLAAMKVRIRREAREQGLTEGRAEGRAEGIDILESLGVSSDLIEKARKIAAEKAKESPSNP